MHEMPAEYRGREQTWLKHRFLREYLDAWAHKLGSAFSDLWFVDCFAGPWESKDEHRRDTSIAIGLRALNEAAASWAQLRQRHIRLHAVFVEKDPAAYRALEAFVGAEKGVVDAHTFHGAFGDFVGRIDALVGKDAVFVFVDPTGWDGAALAYIAKLGRRAGRDVLINVMYDFINRFKDDEREFLRRQMREFFGLGDADLPPGLSEDELMTFYRGQLGRKAGVEWVADVAVPVPDRDRTKFRLVVAGHHYEIVRLFRDIEAKVMGVEAASVRHDAKLRKAEETSRQPALFAPPPPAEDRSYADQRDDALATVGEALLALLRKTGPMQFDVLWPSILCDNHLRYQDLKQLVLDLERTGRIEVRGRAQRERTVHDHHVLAAIDNADRAR